MEEKFAFSIDEAARSLSVSPWTIRLWIRNGKLASTRLGRRVCVTPETLREFVELGKIQAQKKRATESGTEQ